MERRDRPRPRRVVPDFRGLDFAAARAVERRAEVKPADPNPDAPPLSAYWWEHPELVVATQEPAPGAEVYQYDSVRVTLASPAAPIGVVVRPSPPPASSAEEPPRPAPSER